MNREEAVRQATEAFRALYEEQWDRAERMSEGGKTDFTARPLRIGIAPGDGIGPIIMTQARRVLENLLADDMAAGRITLADITGLTIENRLALSQSVPEETLTQIRACPVLLKGPTTTPGGGVMTSANVTLRRALDLYANVRPVSIPSEGASWMFFRENTEGEYALGSRGVAQDGVMAVDFKVTTVAGTRRIARAAFDYARRTGKKRVAVVTKANIMKKTDGLFSAVCREVAAEYPEIETEEYYVDIMSANLVNPAVRGRYQVILTPNLYGDILTDEAAQLQGGVGTAGSVNLGDRYAMFEAIHGSAPRMIAEGLGDYANPESILRAVCMLLEHIGCGEKAGRLAQAIDAARKNVGQVTGDEKGPTCAAFGDGVMAALNGAQA